MNKLEKDRQMVEDMLERQYIPKPIFDWNSFLSSLGTISIIVLLLSISFLIISGGIRLLR